MNRRNVIKSLLTLTSGTMCVSAASIGVLWQQSAPLAEGSVKGVATRNVLASEITPTSAPAPDLLPYATLQDPANLKAIGARQYALYDVEGGRLIGVSDDNGPVPIASTTKIMTSLLAARMLQPDTLVTISPNAAAQIGSAVGMYPGERITVQSLLYGLMLVSGNDAAYALAETAGSDLVRKEGGTPSSEQAVQRFVREMNATASSLRLSATRYHDPAGLNDQGTSSAADLARLMPLLLDQPLLRHIISTPDITVYGSGSKYRHDLHNSNRLLADMPYAGIIGGKTGFTPTAGHCLVAAAERDGHTLVAVVLGTFADTKDASAREAAKLLDIGFTRTNWQ